MIFRVALCWLEFFSSIKKLNGIATEISVRDETTMTQSGDVAMRA